MKKISIFILFSFLELNAVVPLSDELVMLHHATTAEMNAIASAKEGSLIFNTDDSQVYERNVTAWNRISSDGSETKTDTQINDIRAASTEGKQRYHGTCQGVIHHYYERGTNYNYAFGFRMHDGHETAFDQQTYPSTNITVVNDGCAKNDNTLRSTDFDIIDIRVPVINVHTRDNSNTEKFGSPLTNYPAWLR